jgi:hypothetical protein
MMKPRSPASRRARRLTILAFAAIVLVAIATGVLVASAEDERPTAVERSVPWELQSIAGPRLELRYRAGACSGEPFTARPRVVEAPERVTIAVIARHPGAASCAGVVRVGRLHVTLGAALGDRSLVHAPIDRAPGTSEQPRQQFACPYGAADGARLDARRLIGLRLAAARTLADDFDCTVRVIERDGRPLAHTQDLRRDRINVAVRDGFVLRASVG